MAAFHDRHSHSTYSYHGIARNKYYEFVRFEECFDVMVEIQAKLPSPTVCHVGLIFHKLNYGWVKW